MRRAGNEDELHCAQIADTRHFVPLPVAAGGRLFARRASLENAMSVDGSGVIGKEDGSPVAATGARSCLVVILAAGEGKRMRSARAKVLSEVAGLAMLGHVIEAARAAF